VLVNVEETILENEKLIHYVAKRFKNRAYKMKIEYDDLVSEGMIGLLKAVQKFDPEYGCKFSTYAVYLIDGAMRKMLRDTNPGLKFSRPAKELSCKIDGSETAEDIMKAFNVKLILAEEALAYKNNNFIVSMDQSVSNDDDKDLTIGERTGYMVDFSAAEVNDFLMTLPKKLKKVIVLSMQNKTQNEIGNLVGCSQVQVGRYIKRIGKLYQEYLSGGEKEMPKVAFTMSVYEYVELVSKHTIREIAKMKEISEGTLYNWIKAHKEKINGVLSKPQPSTDEKKPSKCNCSKNDKTAEYEQLVKALRQDLLDAHSQLDTKDEIIEKLKNVDAACDDVESEIGSLREEKNKIQGEYDKLKSKEYHTNYEVENQKKRIEDLSKTLGLYERENKAMRELLRQWI
jgi:RNA polymerase sigma factor (sigma-70 family)